MCVQALSELKEEKKRERERKATIDRDEGEGEKQKNAAFFFPNERVNLSRTVAVQFGVVIVIRTVKPQWLRQQK